VSVSHALLTAIRSAEFPPTPVRPPVVYVKVVALVMASHTSGNGIGCSASRATIAREAGCSLSYVARAQKYLSSLGVLIKTAPPGRRTAWTYRLDFAALTRLEPPVKPVTRVHTLPTIKVCTDAVKVVKEPVKVCTGVHTNVKDRTYVIERAGEVSTTRRFTFPRLVRSRTRRERLLAEVRPETYTRKRPALFGLTRDGLRLTVAVRANRRVAISA
jgi:hypothetical protein